MGAFASRRWLQALSWTVAAVILAEHTLVMLDAFEWLASADRTAPGDDDGGAGADPAAVAAGRGSPSSRAAAVLQRKGRVAVRCPSRPRPEVHPLGYRTILVPLDHTERDRAVIVVWPWRAPTDRAAPPARGGRLDEPDLRAARIAAEVELGAKYLDEILAACAAQGIEV